MTDDAASADRLIAQNRKASHDYSILDTIEAGIVLVGTEVKSLRNGKASLQESWASIEGGEAWVHQLHIPPYEQGNRWNVDPVRKRKLLLHRSELDKLEKAITQKGHTLIPEAVLHERPRQDAARHREGAEVARQARGHRGT
jgi:SsrA-binding protein